MATSKAGSAVAEAAKRSAYVSHLRRAFLLRAHPDRFRSHSITLRKNQGDVIQAISERISAPDFIEYTSCSSSRSSKQIIQHDNQQHYKTHKYYLERKDGTLQKQTIQLNDNVHQILTSMANALKSSGVSGTAVTPPPPPPSNDVDILSKSWTNQYQNSAWAKGSNHQTLTGHAANEFNRMQGILWAASQKGNNNYDRGKDHLNLNHTYDINTNKGKNILHFLQSHNNNQTTNTTMQYEIQSKKASRLDAIAAALVARRAYQFQSIDGTGLGWSSASLATCLQTLTKVYDEHNEKFSVQSFYPLRLVLSSDEFQTKKDLYGGTIMLNPAATQLQWLETLMGVTEKDLEVFQKRRDDVNGWKRVAEDALNVKVKKGYSCSSKEFYDVLQRVSLFFAAYDADGDNEGKEKTEKKKTTALAQDRIQIVFETDQACRRALITKEGHIQVSASMSPGTILSSLSRLRTKARRKFQEEREMEMKCKELTDMVRMEFGLTDIYKLRLLTTTVTNQQYHECLVRLLRWGGLEEKRDKIREYLAGMSLVITGSGRFCHLGDDGSIVIPWDWS